MNSKHFESIVGWVSGITGGGVFLTAAHWENELIKFSTAMITALFAGAFGWLGQQLVKHYVIKYKKHNDKHNDNESEVQRKP